MHKRRPSIALPFLNVKALTTLGILILALHRPAEAFLFNDPKMSQDETHQVTKILETFANGCSLTKGPSADAISVVRGLSSAVKSALSTQACQSLAGAMTSLDSTVLQAQSLIPAINDSYVTELEVEVNALQRQRDEIANLLTQTSDPAEIASLQRDLYKVRIELAGALSQAKDSALNDQQIRRAQALRLLLGSTNQAVNQILMNESCWVGQPGLLQQVAGVGSTLGASAALTTAASQKAVLLSAGVNILSTIVDFFQRLSVAKKVAQFDLTLGPTALTCALEKMNDVYCSAQDTLNAIQKVGSQFHDPKADPVWKGVGFLEREIPVLLAWLQKLKSGGSASTVGDSEKQVKIELKEVNLTNSEKLFLGFLRDAQRLYDQTPSPQSRFAIVRRMVNEFVIRICDLMKGPPNVDNPLCTTDIGLSYSFYYLIGLPTAKWLELLKMNPDLSFSSVDLELLAGIGIDATQINLALVSTQFNRWYKRTRENFDIEKRLVLGQDLTLIFDEAIKKNYQVSTPVTPESSLEDLLTFLRRSRAEPDPVEDPQLSLKDEVIQALERIRSQIRAVDEKKTRPELAKDQIYEAADLKFGVSYLGDRVERLIRTELEKLVYSREGLDEVTRLPFLAANDVINELRRYYQVSSLQELQETSANAQMIMINTLGPFNRLFATPMQRAFDDFDSTIRRLGPDGAGPTIGLKTKMCFYYLGATRVPDFVIKECEGLKARSVLGLETPTFSKALLNQPLAQRACEYRNFVMKNRILEKRRARFDQKYPEFFRLLRGLEVRRSPSH
ncbi:MAG: hypothetical protein ACK5Y2_03410 [Bdellovibrionales bacterium]